MSGGWRDNHPWATVYDFVVEREELARPLWGVFMGSDVRLLYRTAAAVGQMPAGALVLDIPCGGGVALRGLRPGQDVRYVAADISTDMLERTRRRAEREGKDQVEVLEADVGRLPFDDDEVDLCLSLTGLHCFPDPAGAVHEMARVLKPGAWLRGSAFLNDTGAIFEPMRIAGRRGGLLGPSGALPDLRRWLEGAGFEHIGIEPSGGLAYFSARMPLPRVGL